MEFQYKQIENFPDLLALNYPQELVAQLENHIFLQENTN
jgi:hypothetical protein